MHAALQQLRHVFGLDLTAVGFKCVALLFKKTNKALTQSFQPVAPRPRASNLRLVSGGTFSRPISLGRLVLLLQRHTWLTSHIQLTLGTLKKFTLELLSVRSCHGTDICPGNLMKSLSDS